MTERIERNVDGALVALRDDETAWVNADVDARAIAESVLKLWYQCQQDLERRSAFRTETAKLVEKALATGTNS